MDASAAETTSTKLRDIDALRSHIEKLRDDGRGGEAIEFLLDLVVRMQRRVDALALRLSKAVNGRERQRLLKLYAEERQKLLDLGQLQLNGVDSSSSTPSVEGATPSAPPEVPEKKPSKPRGHGGRQTLPAHLPRTTVCVPVAESDRVCETHGVERHLVRTETSSVLDYEPGHFNVLVIEREVRACRPCEGGMVIAPVADKVIDGGLPGPGLLAEVVVRKYGEHMPLERMSKSFERQGVHLAPSTLGDWVTAAADSLMPLVQRIETLVFGSFVLSADPTSVRVLDRNEPTGRRFGQMWGMIGDGIALVTYASDLTGGSIETVLARRVGYLQLDGALGFNALFEGPQPSPRERVGCHSHSIRKFKEADEAGDVRAAVPLSMIEKIYDIEKRATADEVDVAERTRRRQTNATPILDELRQWLDRTRPHVPPKTPLGTAIGYAFNQWTSLTRYVEDGRIPIDNNPVERLHRALGIGRRNWLFCGSDEGARRAAVMYTILANCALHGVEPWKYLRDVFWKLATGWPASRLDELLPHRWRAEPAAAIDPAPIDPPSSPTSPHPPDV